MSENPAPGATALRERPAGRGPAAADARQIGLLSGQDIFPTRHFDLAALSAADRYRLLASTIMPRPIAWVVTSSCDGVVNAAPYSFFNLFGADRPVVALGILARPGEPKDTAANIRATGEFVINLVPFALAQAMNATCVDAPPEIDETEIAGLATAPSLAIRPPRIAASPVALECRLTHLLETGPGQLMAVGEVLHAHYAEHVLTGDPQRPRVDHAALDLVGRMHGASAYTRTHDLFDLDRPLWRDRQGIGDPAQHKE
ncbi:MAG TPA: flavin reductase family protein [Bosea sp. (in: a-proteobacteria)]|jgi:flavin reductase (DIM6/NTAB) family NADH-FMN oxidoreductase RutF|uniref:flavin reductase family protein n=1 Tax=Bosea sp. (in: a-proteobacteria) TaxID=1871050 RepID=UPI002E158541|nr:flavin reductase family protein [Bosea sp. (in: a-proteobacteria)]